MSVTVKYFLARENPKDLAPLIPVFHRWIREEALSGDLLIDVTSYAHVPDGPGVMLIGHRAHYGFDLRRGRAGIRYALKIGAEGNDEERLERAVRQALSAARLLEEDEQLPERLRFETGELEISVQDRLRAPNSPQTHEQWGPRIRQCLASFYGPDASFELEQRTDDPREAYTVSVKVSGAPPISALLGG